MEKLKAMFKNDLFASHAGIEIVSISQGHAIARMAVDKKHLNALGTVQGGAIFTLADFAFAMASNSYGFPAVAVNVSINFMKAVSAGVLTAEAKEDAVNPKLGTYTVRVTDDSQNLVAIFQGLAYRKMPKDTARSS